MIFIEIHNKNIFRKQKAYNDDEATTQESSTFPLMRFYINKIGA